MNADLLAMLGGAGSGSSGSGGSSRRDEGKSVLTFKAGKMTTALRPNGKYMVTPDPRRGEINLTWTAAPSTSASAAGTLKFEWKDRRTKAVVDSTTVFADDRCTYSKIDTGRDGDRVYLLQYGNASDRRFFFWMQDKDVESDETNRDKVQKFLDDPAEAGREAAGGEAAAAPASAAPAPAAAATTAPAPSAGASAPAPAPAGQVDALSSILENLGMPPASSSTGTTPATPASGGTSSATPGAPARPSAAAAPAPAPAATGGTLTLADLQGAMAGLATASPTSTSSSAMGAAVAPPGPPLADLATPDAVAESGILDNEETKNKLISLLPEGQRDEEHLLENLRSPQATQALRALTQALMPDPDTGSMEGFHSIVANFQLKAEDGTESLKKGNPIQAFLDCVLKSVEREKQEKGEGKEGSGGDGAGKDDEGDSKKDEEGGVGGGTEEEKMAE